MRTPEERAKKLLPYDYESEFARLVAQAIREAVEEEREACAKIFDEAGYVASAQCIRARGEKK